jgi:CubicO group peptidase (beta-lactamase class C family)
MELWSVQYAIVAHNELPALALKEELLFSPGEQYGYSNVGYSLLARIIESASGETWEVFIRQTLLDPAGLADTGYLLPEFEKTRLAINYGADQNRFQRIFSIPARSRSVGSSLQHRFDKPGPRWMEGAGGFMSTANDMFRWYGVLRSGALLTDASWRETFTPRVVENAQGTASYGYGWVIEALDAGRRHIHHNGSNGYSFATFHYYPEHDAFVFIATNDSDNYPRELMRQLNAVTLQSQTGSP